MQRFAKFKKSLGMASEAPKNFKNLRRLLARSVFFFLKLCKMHEKTMPWGFSLSPHKPSLPQTQASALQF